jgi:hypothetical protein
MTIRRPWPTSDLILDGVGGPVQTTALQSLAPLGRLAVVNGIGGTLDTKALRAHGQSVLGFAMAHLAARVPRPSAGAHTSSGDATGPASCRHGSPRSPWRRWRARTPCCADGRASGNACSR